MDKWFWRTWYAGLAVGCVWMASETAHRLGGWRGPTADERAVRTEQKATRALFDRYLQLECERLERQRPAGLPVVPAVPLAWEL